jgi:hypothetical protein
MSGWAWRRTSSPGATSIDSPNNDTPDADEHPFERLGVYNIHSGHVTVVPSAPGVQFPKDAEGGLPLQPDAEANIVKEGLHRTTYKKILYLTMDPAVAVYAPEIVQRREAQLDSRREVAADASLACVSRDADGSCGKPSPDRFLGMALCDY